MPEKVCEDAFNKGVDAIVLFAIEPRIKLLWAIRWYWRPDRQKLLQRYTVFRDYPRDKETTSRAELMMVTVPLEEQVIEVPVIQPFLATVLDYFRDGVVTADEAAEGLKLWIPEMIPEMSTEKFLQLAGERGIPYFRMSQEEWQEEEKAAGEWVRGDAKTTRQ